MEQEKNLHARIPDGILAEARKLADAQHVSLDEFTYTAMKHYLDEQAAQSRPAVFRPAEELTFEQRRKNLQKLLESVAGNTVVLPNEAMEREAIYEDRGL